MGAAALGQQAAPLERTGLAGQHVSLRSYRGKVVLLSFWATWCGPCLAEAPRFGQWQRDLGRAGLRVIGIAMDDDPTPVQSVVHRLGLPYPVVMGDADLARSYGGVLGLPVTFLVDRQGILRKRYDGAADFEVLHTDVLALLQH